MDSNRASSVFLIALLIFATANPLAHATVVVPVLPPFLPPVLPSNLRGLSVTGRLCCNTTGNCPGQGVAGANVILNCTVRGVSLAVGRATTNATGAFNITIPRVAGLPLGLPVVPCFASVQLPLNSTICAVLSTANGTLASAIRSVGTLLTRTLGLVQNATTLGFLNVTL